jgi:hypothetical protein
MYKNLTVNLIIKLRKKPSQSEGKSDTPSNATALHPVKHLLSTKKVKPLTLPPVLPNPITEFFVTLQQMAENDFPRGM